MIEKSLISSFLVEAQSSSGQMALCQVVTFSWRCRFCLDSFSLSERVCEYAPKRRPRICQFLQPNNRLNFHGRFPMLHGETCACQLAARRGGLHRAPTWLLFRADSGVTVSLCAPVTSGNLLIIQRRASLDHRPDGSGVSKDIVRVRACSCTLFHIETGRCSLLPARSTPLGLHYTQSVVCY